MEFPESRLPRGHRLEVETSFVTLLRNIKRKLQRKGHWEPVQLGLRLWKRLLSSAPLKLGNFKKRYWPFWTSVSPCVNGNKLEIVSLGDFLRITKQLWAPNPRGLIPGQSWIPPATAKSSHAHATKKSPPMPQAGAAKWIKINIRKEITLGYL